MNHYDYEREAIKGRQINAYWDLQEIFQQVILASNKMRAGWHIGRKKRGVHKSICIKK